MMMIIIVSLLLHVIDMTLYLRLTSAVTALVADAIAFWFDFIQIEMEHFNFRLSSIGS